MINHKHKCIFLHIEKNAGTSVEKHLLGYDMWENLETRAFKHLTVERAKKIYKRHWNEYFKFSIVRNPWDRWVSYYAHFLRYEVLNGDFGQFTENPYQTISDLNIRQMYDTFLRTSEGLSLLHCSQKQFLKNEQGEVEVDFICRFENLQQDYSLVCKRIGADPSGLGHDMKTQRSNYRSF